MDTRDSIDPLTSSNSYTSYDQASVIKTKDINFIIFIIDIFVKFSKLPKASGFGWSEPIKAVSRLKGSF